MGCIGGYLFWDAMSIAATQTGSSGDFTSAWVGSALMAVASVGLDFLTAD